MTQDFNPVFVPVVHFWVCVFMHWDKQSVQIQIHMNNMQN